MFKCAEIPYQDIVPFWDKLWPTHNYEAHSAMCYLGGYLAWPPKEIYYYAVQNSQGDIVGVNSCHDTGAYTVRSRGLWVDPKYRGQGLGTTLLTHAVAWAEERNYWAVWSYPKQSAWPAYASAGFVRQGSWITDGAAVNSYAIRFINNDHN